MIPTEAQHLYDEKADAYADSKTKKWRVDVEKYSVFKYVLDGETSLQGKRVLDLGCGDGVYSRELVKLGAEFVVGVDISDEMVKLASQKSHHLNMDCCRKRIEFFAADCSNLDQMQNLLKPHGHDAASFDIILACYLTVYSKSKQELDQFVSVFQHYLKPQVGRLVGIHLNPSFSRGNNPRLFMKYGFLERFSPPLHSGDPIYFDILDTEDHQDATQGVVQMTITNFHLTTEELTQSFTKHHLSLRMERIECDPAVKEQRGDFFDTLVGEQPFVILNAVKG